MARWLVYAFVFLQAAFFVLSEDAETTTVETSSSGTVTPTAPSVIPTRKNGVINSTKPPLVHNLDSSTPATVTEKNENAKQKSGSSTLTAYIPIMMVSIVSIFFCGSAI